VSPDRTIKATNGPAVGLYAYREAPEGLEGIGRFRLRSCGGERFGAARLPGPGHRLVHALRSNKLPVIGAIRNSREWLKAPALRAMRHQGSNVVRRLRLEQGGYALDYKGFEISWPKIPMFSNHWVVNVASNNPRLMAKLGPGSVPITDQVSIDSAVEKAMRFINGLP
jgi:hypothetical protein